MPVFFFALSQVNSVDITNAVLSFIILHFLIYPASNGYNCYMDNDETSIGGVEKPLKPTIQLYYFSIFFDIIGLALSLFISIHFLFLVLLYILASRAYSFKKIRLKKYPTIGFLTVILFQGGFTFWMIYSSIAVSPATLLHSTSIYPALLACSFLIAGVYPLTQIYQHDADVSNGDVTISYRLGKRGTFVFSAIMFLFANLFLYLYFDLINSITQFYILQIFFFPILIYFSIWFSKVFHDPKEASYKNTMRMNWIAATCMNCCFLFLLIIKDYL